MVRDEMCSVCEFCDETYRSKGAAQRCEYQHRIDGLVGKVSNEREATTQDVYEEIIEWLELSFEAAQPVFGTRECPRCDEQVHETWMECPRCNLLLHDHTTSGTLACGNCENTALRLMRKDGVTKGLAVDCPECETFVSHGKGVFDAMTADGPGHEWVGENDG